jgi:hypothetical protein
MIGTSLGSAGPPLSRAVALTLSTVSLRHHRWSKTLVVRGTREESE